VLDSKDVRDSLDKAMQMADTAGAPGTGRRKEVGGIIWLGPDGHYYASVNPDPNATECSYSIQTVPPPIPGSQAVAKYHIHPHRPGEKVYQCRDANGLPVYAQYVGDGKPVPLSVNEDQGGGSNPDWGSVNSDGYPSYTYNMNRNVFRLDAGVSLYLRQNNPNKWHRDGSRCFAVIP
jgi:hypothetical protein